MIAFNCIGLLVFMHCEMPTPPKATTVVCPPVVEWRAEDQKAASDALGALPAGHALRKMATITFKQRAAVRACRGNK